MKKIFIVFMFILLLVLSVVPSFATYSASLLVDDNDSDVSEVNVEFQSSNLIDLSSRVTGYSFNAIGGLQSMSNGSFYYDCFVPLVVGYTYKLYLFNVGYTIGNYGCRVNQYDADFNYISTRSLWFTNVTFDSSVAYVKIATTSDSRPTVNDNGFLALVPSFVSDSSSDLLHTFFNSSVSLESFLVSQSDLYTPLSYIKFSQDGINNRGLYLHAFSDSDLTTDITSDVATSSGLSVDSDGLIYLEFEDGVTDQLYYDGTVYYQVILDPSPPYMYVNLYRHIFENFSGIYTFLTEDNWIFITCVSSIALCFVIFVFVFFFKRFSH